MDVNDMRRLDVTRPSIVRSVTFTNIKDYLVSKAVLTTIDYEDIDSEQTPTKQIQKLLDILPRKGPNGYKHFREALKEGYPWIVKELDSVDLVSQPTTRNRIRPRITDIDHTTIRKITNSEALREFRIIVRRLGLTDADIHDIEYANKESKREQFYQCLEKWKNMKGKAATVEILIQALRHENCIAIADELDGYS